MCNILCKAKHQIELSSLNFSISKLDLRIIHCLPKLHKSPNFDTLITLGTAQQ